MKTTQMESKKKKTYEKPMIRTISIADSVQVLGIGCKLVSGGSAKGAIPCYPGNSCFRNGS